MEELLVHQKRIIDSIEKIKTNFGKDTASRKTTQYIEIRTNKLEVLWNEFQVNHNKLITYEDRSHDYFNSDIYSKTKEYYEIVLNTLLSHKPQQPTDLGAINPQTNPPECPQLNIEKIAFSKSEEMKNQQQTNFRAFLRFIRSIDVEAKYEKWELEDKLQTLQLRWKAVDELHWKIDNILAGSDTFYEHEYSEHETSYENMKKFLNKKLTSSTHQQLSTPQIHLPTFAGNYSQWPTFMDLYCEAIHNNASITKAHKMQHLKGKLEGEAKRLVQHLTISAENYDTCWEILFHRYNNKQLLFTTQIKMFMNQQRIQNQTACELKKLHDVTMETIHAIHNLGVDTSTWDPILVHILSEKLDSKTFADYMESRKSPRELPSFEELMAFIESKFTALEPTTSNKTYTNYNKQSSTSTYVREQSPKFQQPNNIGNKYQKPTYNARSYHTTEIRDCPLCKMDHILFHCKQYGNMNPENKLKTISQLNICPNCLYCHNNKQCSSKKRCKECGGEHHTSLHESYIGNTISTRPTTSSAEQSVPNKPNVNMAIGNNAEVLLATMQLNIQNVNGEFIQLRALLDQGSQITLISQRAAQQLALPRRQHHATVAGVGSNTSQSKGMVTLVCESIYGKQSFTTEAIVMNKMINNLPNTSFEKKHWPHIQNLNLADPDYNISRPVDILLDAGIYTQIIMSGILRGQENAPIAQQTTMGWVLLGNVKTYNCHAVLNDIENIAQFWEMEHISDDTISTMTSEDEECENLYKTTTKRTSDGRYVVKIPMKKGYQDLIGTSRSQAIAQFLQQEKRFDNNISISQSYKDFMNEYLQLGHMKESNPHDEPSCYLRHHGVLKPESSTTSLRVVYNGAAKTSTGYSLNDLMMGGPNLQKDLLTLMLRWRTYKFVYTADIEKFYRQVQVHEQDQKLQKIIWRDNKNEKLKEYQLCRVTYGLKASAFLAMRTIKQLIQDEGTQYTLAAHILENQLYVDDLLGGSNDITIAQETQSQLIQMLQKGGFNLRKWASNDTRLLHNLSPEQINTKILDFKQVQSTSNKTLGISWNPHTDCFTFQRKFADSELKTPTTKRSMLSEMSRLFDPLGWLSPVTLQAKIMFQDVWASGITWDEPLPEKHAIEWNKFRHDMQIVDTLQIPRWIGDTSSHVQLHGFSDASEKAFGCVIYAKTKTEDGKITIRLIAAKTRLAPLNKEVSLPRLELCGALLLTQLMKKVKDSIITQSVTMHGWTDSMVVIGWLQGEITRWKQFVANRVRQIIEFMPSTSWNHLKSGDNSADLASRPGQTLPKLISNSFWWEGPQWLKQEHLQNNKIPIQIPNLETKTTIKSYHVQNSTSFVVDILRQHNSMTTITRLIAWISRFISNSRNKDERVHTIYLLPNEVDNAYKMILKHVQSKHFEHELLQLRTKRVVNCKSKILSLHPYIDEDGLLRVGGRLKHSQLSPLQKHPIIVPNNDRVTELLIDQAHLITLHGGAKLTLGYIRNRYWIISGYRTVKKRIRQCVKCHRYNNNNNNQLMGDLPKQRVTPSRPFTHTGVDFTGSVQVKANKGRGIKTTKGYIAVFVCLSTKAVHIELVSDLSTPTFQCALKRFCARRGKPAHVYSDNGTNFVGAARKIDKEYRTAIKEYINTEILNYVADQRIQWHFNAPLWPSAGGLWESAVRSLKHHLRRVIGNQHLTFEEYSTLLSEVEACLNSRPLVPLTENIEDLDYLTPGHFLTGDSLLSPPTTLQTTSIDLRSRWQLTEKMYKDFWKKWSNEYLHTLQTRNKWHLPKQNIDKGQLVLVKEDNIPPGRWLMGRVTDTHPGKDGYVRVVTLKTKNGTMKRPIIKLSPLPMESPPTDKQATIQDKPKKQKRN